MASALIHPGWMPILAQATLRDVALFYSSYLLAFSLFVGLVGFLKAMAKRALLKQNNAAALVWYDRLWFLFAPAVRKELKPQIEINLAVVHASLGHKSRAFKLLRDARKNARLLKTPELLIEACLLNAHLYIAEGHPDLAMRSLTEARTASEKHPGAPGLLTILHRQADLQTKQGLHKDALTTWHAIRRLADKQGVVGTAILALTHIGRDAYNHSDWDQAEESFEAAASRARHAHCTDRSAVLAYVLFGRLMLQRGRYDLARGYLDDAAKLAEKRAEPRLQCTALLELGRLDVERGRYRDAEHWLSEADALAIYLQDGARRAMVAQVCGDAAFQSESFNAARYHYEEAAKYLAKHPLLHTEILVRTGLAMLASHMDDFESADAMLMEAERLALRHRASFELVCVYDAMARMHAQAHNGDEAQRYQTMAHDVRRELGIEAAISKVYRNPGRIRRIGAA